MSRMASRFRGNDDYAKVSLRGHDALCNGLLAQG